MELLFTVCVQQEATASTTTKEESKTLLVFILSSSNSGLLDNKVETRNPRCRDSRMNHRIKIIELIINHERQTGGGKSYVPCSMFKMIINVSWSIDI